MSRCAWGAACPAHGCGTCSPACSPRSVAKPAGGCPASSCSNHPEVRMRSVCVYCGSNSGSKPAYAERAMALGHRLAKDGLALVYGGGNVGLMGIVADAVLEA